MLQKSKYILLLLILSFIIHNRWIIYPIITHGDWMFHFSKTISDWVSFPMIWTIQSNFGDINIGLPGWPFYFIYGLFGFLNLNSNIADKFVFLIPITIMTGLSSYILIKKIVDSDMGALIGSFVFSYNTYILLLQTGHLLLMIAFSFVPLVIYYFIKTLEEKKFRYVVITALILFIVGIFEIRACYILSWLLIFFFLFKILFIERRAFSKKLFQLFLFSFLTFFIFFLLNSYWLFGFTQIGALTQNPAFSSGLWGSGYFNLAQALALFHPFWTTSGGVVYDTQPIPAYFFLVPVFAFLGLWLNRKNKNILFFAVISLVGILLTKQEREPFALLYKWLFNYLPGFKAFREASKFYFLISLGYSVLIGSFVGWMWKNWRRDTYRIYGKYFITVLIACLFLFNTKQYITGEIGTLFKQRQIPNDYLIVKDYILKQPEFFRTLWIPTSSRWSIYTESHPKISHVVATQYTWKDLSKYGQWDNNIPLIKQINYIFKQPFPHQLFDLSSIKYLLIPVQDKANDDDFFPIFGPRQEYLDELSKLDYLKRVDINTQEIAVYENSTYRPHIYITAEKETISKDVPLEKINFKFINLAEYKISLNNISSPIYLNFSENYHRDWKIHAGTFHWFDVLAKKNYFLPDDNHFQNDAKLNSFLIDPMYIKQNTDKKNYKINHDGSIDLELTLYFKPQSYCYLGLIISGTVFVLCLVYLGAVGVRKLGKYGKLLKT